MDRAQFQLRSYHRQIQPMEETEPEDVVHRISTTAHSHKHQLSTATLGLPRTCKHIFTDYM